MSGRSDLEQVIVDVAEEMALKYEDNSQMFLYSYPFLRGTLGGGPRKPIDAKSVMLMASTFPHGSIFAELAHEVQAYFSP